MPELTCPRCSNAVHRPPQNGKNRCFNCGHSWDADLPRPDPLKPGATVEELLEALFVRGAWLEKLQPMRTGAIVTIAVGGLQLTLQAKTRTEALALAIAKLDDAVRVVGSGT